MFWDHVSVNWTDWTSLLARYFPYHPIPRKAPAPQQRDEFVAALARAHQLTKREVLEMLDTLLLMALPQQPMRKRAAVGYPSNGVWPL